MKDKDIKWPPEGKRIYVSLRESNGEHGIYECIYMGMGIFKFLQNGKQYACEIGTVYLTNKTENKDVGRDVIFLLGKEMINWWVAKDKEDQNENTTKE